MENVSRGDPEADKFTGKYQVRNVPEIAVVTLLAGAAIVLGLNAALDAKPQSRQQAAEKPISSVKLPTATVRDEPSQSPAAPPDAPSVAAATYNKEVLNSPAVKAAAERLGVQESFFTFAPEKQIQSLSGSIAATEKELEERQYELQQLDADQQVRLSETSRAVIEGKKKEVEQRIAGLKAWKDDLTTFARALEGTGDGRSQVSEEAAIKSDDYAKGDFLENRFVEERLSQDFRQCVKTEAQGGLSPLSCINAEIGRQDKLLNATYRNVMANLSTDEQGKLRQAQRGWIAARDARCKDESDNPKPDSTPAIAFGYCYLERTMERLIDLERIVPSR